MKISVDFKVLWDSLGEKSFPMEEDLTLKSCMHSGNAGDIIYSLPTVKELKAEHYVINLCTDPDSGEGTIHYSTARALAPLLLSQPYIKRVRIVSSNLPLEFLDQPIESVNFILDKFRLHEPGKHHIAICHALAFGVYVNLYKKWLHIGEEKPEKEYIVLSLNPRSLSLSKEYWPKVLAGLDNLIVIGLSQQFHSVTGITANSVTCTDLLEMAKMIQGSRLFIGNPSLPYAIAEGLKVPRIVEVSPEYQNVYPIGRSGNIAPRSILETRNLINRLITGLPEDILEDQDSTLSKKTAGQRRAIRDKETEIEVGAAGLKKKMVIPEDVKKILIPRFDTIGDIILLEGFIEALIGRFPNAEITLLVREGYEQLAPLFPKKLNWMTTPLSPYRSLEERDFEDLSSLLDKIAEGFWDLLLTTTYSRTWMDDLLATKLNGISRIALGEKKEIVGWIERLFKKLNLEIEQPYDDVIAVNEDLHETEKYQQFWNKLFMDEKKLSPPRIVITEDIEQKAKTVLSELNLKDKEFFVCAPTGTQNVSIKVWPAERFAEVISWINEEIKLKPLLIGHESEQEVMNELAEVLKDKGIESHVWIGRNGELPILAGIMQKASFYLGNDAGPMHIAAAVGIPVVGIFGGGTWPRFLPVGRNSIAIAGELPCFGCNWECVFEDAPCMRLVEVDDVKKAIRIILSGNVMKSNILRSSQKITTETAEYIEKAIKRFQFLKSVLMDKLERSEADRAARLEVTQDLKARFEESEVDREARLKEINRLSEQLQESEADRAARLEMINELRSKLQESEADRAARLKVINKLSAQLQESEADGLARLEVIHKLEAQIRKSEADRAIKSEVIDDLGRKLQESEADRTAKLELIDKLETLLKESEMDRLPKGKVIDKLTEELRSIQSSKAYRLLKKINLLP